jgi:hypothetical protein
MLYYLPDWLIKSMDEDMENLINVKPPKDKTEEDIRRAIESAGIEYNADFEKYMSDDIKENS